MDTLFKRRPLLFGVKVDGRLMGRPFRVSALAQSFADELTQESPWSVVEVEEMFA